MEVHIHPTALHFNDLTMAQLEHIERHCLNLELNTRSFNAGREDRRDMIASGERALLYDLLHSVSATYDIDLI